ncbi:MAG TPA: hypothetical protein VFI13_11140 [Gemmatimonadales bacterium]|nr:hypothetical protein [Gemmatimonadales bacterium]
MRRSFILVLPLLAACGHPLWPTMGAVSPVAVSETYQCADSVAKSLGYKQFQAKPAEGFLRTRRGVTAGLANVFDQVAYDQLRIEVSASGAGSALKVTAESYVEQVSRRGREETERPARDEVIADARTEVEVCAIRRVPRTDRVPDAG